MKETRATMEYDLSEYKTRTWTIEEAIQVFTDTDTLRDAKERIIEFYNEKHAGMDYDTLESEYSRYFKHGGTV